MAKDGGSVVFTFEGDDKKINSTLSSLGKGLITTAKLGTTAITGLSTAITGIVTAGVKSYADLEQNIGGIETLFKDSAKAVIDNSKKAYETAGMSANEYMETVTGFSASLLQSLGGDTEKAVSYADRAVTDMADNANKMGTAMESIQYAYQGFAKQNYTMLDNLKLGYGGTKEEMQRLISDAAKLTDIQKELGITVDENSMSFGNIVNAISVVQKNIGIMGTTSAEASDTISGSISSMKAAFDNFANGTGDIETLAETMVTAFSNVADAIVDLAPDIADGLVKLADKLMPKIPALIKELLPSVLSGSIQIVQGLTQIAPQLFQTIMSVIQQALTMLLPQLPTITQNLINGIAQIITYLAQALPTMIPMIIDAILGLIPILLDNLPLFIDAGMQLLIGLLTGILNALPDLIVELPNIIFQILQTLLSLIFVQIPKAGVQIITSLIDGLFSYWGKMTSKIKEFAKGTILEPIVNFATDMIDKGRELVEGLWEGIKNAANWLKEKIKGWIGNVLDFIKGLFGINSPSTEFAYFGRMNVLGLEEGMESMEDDLNATIGDMVNLSPSLLATASNPVNNSINVVVNNQFEQDPLGQVVSTVKTFSGGAKNDFNFGYGG